VDRDAFAHPVIPAGVGRVVGDEARKRKTATKIMDNPATGKGTFASLLFFAIWEPLRDAAIYLRTPAALIAPHGGAATNRFPVHTKNIREIKPAMGASAKPVS